MKLTIILALFCVTVVYGRLITQDEPVPEDTPVEGARWIKANDGSNVLCFHCEETDKTTEWYTNGVFYQIYPRSFQDSNGDGDGDLQGIRMRLKHLKNLGVNGVWLSPVFKSPQKDGGYDISSYVEIDPIYGTLSDMDDLILEAKRLGIKLILDFVPNHTSDQHEWFQDSIKGIHPFDDYYVWVDGKDCLPEEDWDEEEEVVPCKPPNNWVSVFAGPAWEWNWERKQFYLHQFVKEQPDVNFDCHMLRQEFIKILNFWMERGIDGFRVDAINHAYEAEGFPDESLAEWGSDPTNWADLWHNHTKDLPKSFEVVYDWRDVLDRFSLVREVEPKIMMTEAYGLFPETVFRWMGNMESGRIGSQIAFNFIFISDLKKNSNAKDFATNIQYWLDNIPASEKPNWVLGNHDQSRLASRFSPEQALMLAFLEMTLPGYAVIYNGEEIGMVDNTKITWEETRDPGACNTNESVYMDYSRDPARTPFQWDATDFGGFTKGPVKPWLPVNDNYKTLNLEMQLNDTASTYNIYRTLIRLRREEVFQEGTTKVHAFEEENVLAVLRSHGDTHFVTVINLNGGENATRTVDLTKLDEERADKINAAMLIFSTPKYHPPHSFEDEHEHDAHEVVNSKNFQLGPYDAVIVQLVQGTSSAATASVSIALLFVAFARFFF